MRFLANENIPLAALKRLRKEGFDISSVFEQSPAASDEDVLNLASLESRIVITFDKDFSEFSLKHGSKIRGIILLPFSPQTPEFVSRRLIAVLRRKDFDLDGQITVVEEARIRQRKLKR